MIETFAHWLLWWIGTGMATIFLHKFIKEPSRLFKDSEIYFWGTVLGFITPVFLISAYIYELYNYFRQ